MARALHIRPSTASEMKRRGSIPAEYWQDLLEAARRHGIQRVTADALIKAHGRKGAGPDRVVGTEDAGTEDAGTDTEPSAQRGHFSRFYRLARPHFATTEAVRDHVSALRDEWDKR